MQLPPWQDAPSVQTEQVAPPAPQASAASPSWHFPSESQQPAGQLEGPHSSGGSEHRKSARATTAANVREFKGADLLQCGAWRRLASTRARTAVIGCRGQDAVPSAAFRVGRESCGPSLEADAA